MTEPRPAYENGPFARGFRDQSDVKVDPAWGAAESAVEQYVAAVSGHMVRDEEGCEYWEPRSRPSDPHAPPLDEVLRARGVLLDRYNAVLVDSAMRSAAIESGLYEGYEPGTDVDRVTFYEPNGNPGTALRQAFAVQNAEVRYRGLDDAGMREVRSKTVNAIEDELLGDNFTTAGRLREEVRAIDAVLKNRETDGPAGRTSPSEPTPAQRASAIFGQGSTAEGHGLPPSAEGLPTASSPSEPVRQTPNPVPVPHRRGR